MAMRWALILAALACSTTAGVAAAQSCPVSASNTRPTLPGRLVFEDYWDSPLQSNVYLYDFAGANDTTTPFELPIGSWGLAVATNPVFSPDGQAVVFSARPASDTTSGRSDLYYWVISNATPSPSPYQITDSGPGIANEDVKFSPDGTLIAWKQSTVSGSVYPQNIVIGHFSFDDFGAPVINNTRTVASGNLSSASEKSAPVFSANGGKVYYFVGSRHFPPEQIGVVGVDGGASGTAFSPQPTDHYFYYPIVDDAGGQLFYTSGALSGPNAGFDHLFVEPDSNNVTGAGMAWNTCDTMLDDSDPAPVDGDYFIFSRDHSGGNGDYELFLGQLSTGKIWSLAAGVNAVAGSLRGSNYTSTRPTVSPFLFGKSAYRSNDGAMGGAGGLPACRRFGVC